MRTSISILLFLCLILVGAGCGAPAENHGVSEPVSVFTAIAPVAWLTQQLGGPAVTVRSLAEAGADPHTFEPSARQVGDIVSSDIYVHSGLSFERHIVESIIAEADITVIHIQPESEREDPHFWLSPAMLKRSARLITDALVAADPGNGDTYRENLHAFRLKLDPVQVELETLLRPHEGKSIYVQHPAYGALLSSFNIEQIAVERYVGGTGARHLEQLIEQMRSGNVKSLFGQQQLDPAPLRTVADATGAEIVILDPLEENLLENIPAIARAMAAALAARGDAR